MPPRCRPTLHGDGRRRLRPGRPSSWRDLARSSSRSGPTPRAPRRSRRRLQALPPLVFAGEARAAALGARRGRRRARVPAPGGRLRRVVPRLTPHRDGPLLGGRDPRAAEDPPADGGRAHLRRRRCRCVKVGRIAGQFVKPRSSAVETIGDGEIPVFRGHMVHDDAPTAEARMPDPERMVEGYHQSAATLNLVRAFTKGGFADLTQVHSWNQEFVAQLAGRASATSSSPPRSSARSRSWPRAGSTSQRAPQLHQVDVWTSHEGLLLDYEEGLTRRDSLTGDWYDCSAHMLWIGERTRQPDGAHVEFFSGVHNPLGVKLGPDATPDEVVELVRAPQPRPRPRAADADRADGRRPRRASCCRRCCVRCARPGTRSSGPATRCTRTCFETAAGARRAASTRSWPSSRASSPPAGPRASGRAAFTSSSPART